MSKEIVKAQNTIATFTPANLAEALTFAKLLSESDLVPKDYKGKAGNCLVAMQMGAELGVPPMQALQNIAVINGRPAVWGDLILALVQKSPHYEWHSETFDEATMTAFCTMKRKGAPEAHTVAFSKADAEKARLWGKEGPWTAYPKRMLTLRARAFCARDVFADALKGIAVAEEVADYDVEVTVERTAPAMPRELPAPVAMPQPVEAPEPQAVQPEEPKAPEAQALPEGYVQLTSVTPGRSGKRKDGSAYQAYEISWAGGKEECFSTRLYATAQECLAEKRPVKLTVERRANGQLHVTDIAPLA